jgi:hypothetical protein
MKKIIPILIVALLAVGLVLPTAEPADAIELSVSVAKTANPTSISEPGDDVEFTVVVTNDGLEDVTIDALLDTDFDLAAHCPDAAGMELASGETYTCVLTEWIAGNAGDNHENTVTAIATDNAGYSNTVSDNAIVTIDDVQSAISVTKTADPTLVPEPGGDVTFTVDICNDGVFSDPVTIDSLMDTVHGDLNGQGDCSVPQTILPGDCYTCSFTEYVAGNAGHIETDVVTASGVDDDGSSVSDDDDATVTVTDVPLTVTLNKTANPTSVPEPGGVFTFTLNITNTSDEQVIITDLTDDNTLSVECLALIGTTIPAGGWTSCAYTITHTDAGSYDNTAYVTVQDNEGNSATASDDATVTVVIGVDIDIKPGSDPNSINVKSKGVLPVAILGSADFDTTQVDPVTMLLSWDGMTGGIPGIISPLRWNWEDINGDGFMDMGLKYSMGDLMTYTVTNEPPGPLTMTLMGNLKEEHSGTPIAGEDTVRIINKLVD